jgi:small subunit ribosomal protein S9
MPRKKAEEVEELPKRQKDFKRDYISTTGRRKSAVARVRLYPKATQATWGEHPIEKGTILVNGKKATEYFFGDVFKTLYEAPLKSTNTLGQVALTIAVAGGGPKGQLEACIHGIARALSELDKAKFRPILKKQGYLTRDSRIRERRKAGMGGKARRKRQSPKR